MKKLYFVFVLSSFILGAQVSTKGKEFWVSFMENVNGNGTPQFSLLISSDVTTSGSVIVPHTGYTISFTVAAGQTNEIMLPANIYYPQGDENIFNFGLQVISLDSISIYSYHHKLYFSEASIVLPIGELGTQYMILARKDDQNYSPSEFIVEATHDSTVVEITPSVVTVSFRPPGTPFTITLNKGQVLQIQANDDLSGSIVRSLDPAKKIAIFSGARQAYIGCSGADDHLYEQNYPMSSWGTQFIAFPFYNHNDLLRVLALNSGTQVTINGNTINLAAGQFLDYILAGEASISASQPVAVAQFEKSQSCNGANLGDPAISMVLPIKLKKKHAAIFKASNITGLDDMTNHYVNITCDTIFISSVQIDNMNVASYFSHVPGSNYAIASVPVTAGNHVLTSGGTFQATLYGFGQYNSYAFPLGYDKLGQGEFGIQSYGNAGNSSLYPNPLHDESILEMSPELARDCRYLTVYDALGKLALTLPVSGVHTLVKRGALESGVYFYTLLDSRANVLGRGKLVVEK